MGGKGEERRWKGLLAALWGLLVILAPKHLTHRDSREGEKTELR